MTNRTAGASVTISDLSSGSLCVSCAHMGTGDLLMIFYDTL